MSYEEKLDLKIESQVEIIQCFENFNEVDWREFLRDLASNPIKLSVKFNIRTGDNILVTCSVLLAKLGVATRKHISKALDVLVIEALRQLTKPEYENFIRSYFHIAKSLGEGIRTDLLRDIITDNNIQTVIRKDAAAVLANYHLPVSVSFWEDFDLSRNSFLFPPAISSLGKNDPIKALELLEKIDNSINIDEIFTQLKYPIKTTLIFLERNFDSSFGDQINEALNNLHPRIKEYIETLPEYQTIFTTILPPKSLKKQESILQFPELLKSPFEVFCFNVNDTKKLPYYLTGYQAVNIFDKDKYIDLNDSQKAYLNAIRDEVKKRINKENIRIPFKRRQISGIEKLVEDILSGEVLIPEVSYGTRKRGERCSLIKIGELKKGSILVPDNLITDLLTALDIESSKSEKLPTLSNVLDYCIDVNITWISQPNSAISQVLDDLFTEKMNEYDMSNSNRNNLGGIENPEYVIELLRGRGKNKPRYIAVLDYLTAVYIKKQKNTKKFTQLQIRYETPLPVGFFFPKNDKEFLSCIWNAVNNSFFNEKDNQWDDEFKGSMRSSLITLDKRPTIAIYNKEKSIWEAQEESNEISSNLKIKQA